MLKDESGRCANMETITVHSHVGEDGVLKLQVPLLVTNMDLEVVLMVQPLTSVSTPSSAWPEGFFEAVAGGWQGEPLMRESQGDYETRDNLE
jgi:hypothetical protein